MPNIEYQNVLNRKKYLSIEKHQRNANNSHAKWISIAIERDLFDYADYGNFQKTVNNPVDEEWNCPLTNNMWSLSQTRESVGLNNEQFGFFQRPVNNNDPWHGFPIIPFSKSRYNLSKEIIELWIRKGIIDIDDVSSITKKKRI